MAKLYFYYSAMNAGKSTYLLQARYNYLEHGMRPVCFKPAIDTRSLEISSRIGLSAPCIPVGVGDNIVELLPEKTDCVLVDEAQFLSRTQVEELCYLVDTLGVPVLCYGLRTDFLGHTFPGSEALLALADVLVELKTVCYCGSKATMNLRVDSGGVPVRDGEQVCIGGNSMYVPVCRRHFFSSDAVPVLGHVVADDES